VTAELALTPDLRWEADVPGLAAAASAAGFTAVGVAAARADQAALAGLDSAGIRCHEILALAIEEDGVATVRSAELLTNAADTMRAPWVLTIFRAQPTGDTLRVIQRCAAMFSEAGAAMAVEFSPFGPVTSIPLGLRVVEAAGGGRAGLLIDSWHFFRGSSSWEDLERVPLEQIAYVQFDDALAPISDDMMFETMERRVMPGEGMFELERFASTLLDRGWGGVVSVEVLNAELRGLPVADITRRAHAAAARFWK
jgi:sugar phosphate isomerase/epimerase